MYSSYILKAQEMAVSSASPNEVMRSFAENSFEKLRITSIKYFRVDVGNEIELIASYGEQFAIIENGKYVKRDQKLPVCDVIHINSVSAEIWKFFLLELHREYESHWHKEYCGNTQEAFWESIVRVEDLS